MNTISSVIRRSAFPITQRHVVTESSAGQNYAALLEAVGDAEVVMIGEASHGTHDFYQQRAEITKQLILKKNFTFIAIEGDWPDAYRVNRYVQHGKRKDNTAVESLGDFKRFPLWMWRNRVVVDFVEWLRQHNDQFGTDIHKKVAFYGMDLYSFYSSMDAVIEYLEKVSPEDAKVARRRYSNFDRFQGEPAAYGHAAGFGLSHTFEKEVVSTLLDLKKKEEVYLQGAGGLIDGDELFYTQQNAELVKNAEEYYRKMYQADDRTWNLRDKHMVDCVSSLFNYHKKKFKGARSEKVVIWAHNSHLGDARQTDAGQYRGEWNVGQLMRERFGLTKTFNIGFSTYQGTVTAAKSWDKPAQCMKVRNGLMGSYEHVLHSATENWDHKDYYMLFRSNSPQIKPNPELVDTLLTPRYERYIGVIYRPDTEKASHYCKSSLPKEYDAVIFLDQTQAIEPIDPTKPWQDQHDAIMNQVDPDTFPELEQFSFLQDDQLEWRLESAKAISQVGTEMMKQGDFINAIAKFDKALQYVEYNLKKHQGKRPVQDLRLSIMIERADAYYNLKLWSGVIRDCTTIINLDPSHFQAHLLLGKAYEEKGQESIAKHHFEMAAKHASQEWKTVSYQRR